MLNKLGLSTSEANNSYIDLLAKSIESERLVYKTDANGNLALDKNGKPVPASAVEIKRGIIEERKALGESGQQKPQQRQGNSSGLLMVEDLANGN